MAEACVATREFQHVLVADEIGARVGGGVFQRIAHTGLGGEMQDCVVALGSRRCGESARIRDVGFGEAEGFMALQPGQPGLFQRGGVVGIEVVHARDGVSPVEERPGGMVTDESGAAGQKNAHDGERLAFLARRAKAAGDIRALAQRFTMENVPFGPALETCGLPGQTA